MGSLGSPRGIHEARRIGRPAPAAAYVGQMRHRLYLIEDHPVMREAYVSLLTSEADFDLCGQSETAEDALATLTDGLCDLVVTDVGLPGMSGLDLLEHIHERWPTLPVLVLTGRPDYRVRRYAEEAGASAFLGKGEAPALLLDTIRGLLAARPVRAEPAGQNGSA